MELRQLEHFVAVAEDGSFTKAARRLNYVQSALSVSVQGLERELGVRLFDRTTHRVTLTGAGEAIVPTARRTLAAVEETLDVAAAFKGVLRGRLRVGIMQAFTYIDVADVLGQFHRLHPGVEIGVHPAAGGTAALLTELRQGTLDAAFVALIDPPTGMTTIPLGSENLVLVGPPDKMPSGQRAVRLDALSDASFIDFPAGWGVRIVVDRAFGAVGVERRVTMEIADVATCLQLVGAGLGVALFPPSMVPADDPRIRVRPTSPNITWHVVMATPAGRTSAAIDALTALVHEARAVARLP
jgi:DNA-binding transcriptional LysR family regulator